MNAAVNIAIVKYLFMLFISFKIDGFAKSPLPAQYVIPAKAGHVVKLQRYPVISVSTVMLHTGSMAV
jgi:hypothetical protein